MTKNLVHSLKDDLTPELCESISFCLGEHASAVHRTLDTVLPLLVGNLARHVTEVAQIDRLYAMIESSDSADSDVVRLAAKLRSADVGLLLADGKHRASSLLGARAATIADAETAIADLRPDSAQKLVGLAMVMVLAELKRELVTHSLDQNGLTYLLMSQKAPLDGQIDPVLAEALGYADPAALIAGIASVPEGNAFEPSWFQSLRNFLRQRPGRPRQPGDVRGPDTLHRLDESPSTIGRFDDTRTAEPRRPDKTLH